ncbi:MAG: DUF4065 domain-containing protein [Holosporales bacterium]|jgi:uncharacterized phage-associated protein|nr:DUF4065 domain-containing protein [Holosporales bacterium]
MANIFDVADYILTYLGGDITTMKLQKLCYYSQAVHLAKHSTWKEGIALFNENFEKWDQGPVCPDLFHCHKGMFYINLVSLDINDKLSGEKPFNEEERLSIEEMLEKYGAYTGVELSETTHKEEPWKKTPKNMIIEKKDIWEWAKKTYKNGEKRVKRKLRLRRLIGL